MIMDDSVHMVHTVRTVASHIVLPKESYIYFHHLTKKVMNSNFSIWRIWSFLSDQHCPFEEEGEGKHPDRWTPAIVNLQTNADDIRVVRHTKEIVWRDFLMICGFENP